MTNESISKKSDILKNHLLYAISTGTYRAGDAICAERDLCQQFNLSRNTVRLAIDELASEGILSRKPRSGTVVTKQALELISRQTSHTDLNVVFRFPPFAAGNPLAMQLIQTCCDNLDNAIGVEFSMMDSETCLPLPKADILVDFGSETLEHDKRCQQNYLDVIALNMKHDSLNYLSADNVAGGKLMAHHALELGHRHIGIIHLGNGTSQDFKLRLQGMQHVLKDADASVYPMAIVPRDFYHLEPDCYQAFFNLRSRHPDMTAVLCVCDMIALGVINSCRQGGIAIPKDLGIIGFDDQNFAQYLSPKLTTVKYPSEAMGLKLARYINDRLHAQTAGVLQEVVKPILVPRDSIRPITP